MQRVRSFQFALATMLVLAVLATGSAQAQTYTESVLHSFTGYPGDGATPYAGLVRDAQGNLYGTTLEGGASSGWNRVQGGYDRQGDRALQLHRDRGDGANPYAGLVQDAQGNLYGTTFEGGDPACSVWLRNGVQGGYDRQGDRAVQFTGGTDGANPLRRFSAGRAGQPVWHDCRWRRWVQSDDCGTVFKVDTTGKETVLYSFTGSPGDGAVPEAGLVRDAQGNLYGTTAGGGAFGRGTVFEVDMTGKETRAPPLHRDWGGRRKSRRRFSAGRAGQPVWHDRLCRGPCMLPQST